MTAGSWNGTSFSYDQNGNLTSDGLTSYTRNARNQLAGLSGSANASFAYDAFGRRQTKTVGGTSTNFLYDGVNMVQELSGTTPTANLLNGLGVDETFTRNETSGTSTLLVDALGSTLELADATGALRTHYTYDPFGATRSTGSTSANAREFTGRDNDAGGLYFFRARYYSPSLQRFVAEDPFEFLAGDVNLYSYSFNAPTNYRDPFGTDPAFGVWVGIIGGGFYGGLGAWNSGQGSTSEVIVGALIGAGVGGYFGLLNPTLGVGTWTLIGGASGGLGDSAI